MRSNGRLLPFIIAAIAITGGAQLDAQTVSSVNPAAITVHGGQSAQVTLVGSALDSLNTPRLLIGGATAAGVTVSFISPGPTQRRVSIVTNTQLVSGTATLQAHAKNGWVTVPLTITTVAAPSDANVTITALSLSPSAAYANSAVSATVTVSPAPAGSIAVEIVNDSTGAVLKSGTVAAGATSATLALPPQTAGGKVLRARRPPYATGPTASLQSHPVPQIMPFSSSLTFNAGQSKPVAVSLSPTATLGGVLTVSSSSSAIIVPSTVPVSPGQNTVIFTAGVANVPQSTTGSLTLAFGASQQTVAFNLVGSSPSPNITAITPSADTVTGGNPVSFVASLSGAANSSGLSLKVTSSTPNVVVPPASVSLAAGATSTQVTVNTAPVSAPTTAQLTIQLGSSTVTASVTVRPPSVAGVSFTPPFVAGQTIAAKVSLDALVASPPGVTVNLTSSDPTVAQPPASVTVLPGAFEQTFTIPTSANFAQSSKYVSITAQTAGNSAVAGFALQRQVGVVSALSFAPALADAGTAVTGTVTLDKPSKPGGTTVNLTSASPAVTLPATVTVPAGQTSQTFSLTTSNVSASTAVSVTATDGVNTTSGTVTVRPPVALQDLSAPFQIEGGQGLSLTLVPNHALQSGLTKTVALSSNHAALQLPSSYTLACCSTSFSIPVTTTSVSADQAVVVSATLDGVTVADTVLVRAPPTVTFVGINPDVVWGGQPSSATISLNRAVTNATSITLSASPATRVTIPSVVVVPAGASSATAQIATTAGSQQSVVITATLNGTTATDSIVLLTPSLSMALGNHAGDTLSAFSTQSVVVNLGGPRAPAPLTLTLSASPSGMITTPASVTIQPPMSNASFSIAVGAVTNVTGITLTASGYGVSVSKQIWVKP